jgi:hypothetical protein
MKRTSLLILFITVIAAACIKDRSTTAVTVTPPVVVSATDTLIHYWNCNVDTLHVLVPTRSIGGGSMVYAGSRFDTLQPGSNINGIGADSLLTAPGAAGLRLRNPAGPFTINLPTTGYKNIKLRYAVSRSSKGAQTNTVSYSVDGTNFINTAIAASATYTVDTVYHLVSFDFSSDAGVNDNANFKVQLNFSNATSTTSGNDRFDNFTVYGEKK